MSMPNPLSRYEFRAFIFSRFPRCSVYVSESKRSKIRNWSTRPSYKVLAALPEGGKMSHRECGRGAARAWPLRRRTDEETKAVESGYVLTISLRTLLFSAFLPCSFRVLVLSSKFTSSVFFDFLADWNLHTISGLMILLPRRTREPRDFRVFLGRGTALVRSQIAP